MLYNDKTIRSLEFDKIRAMLADCASTEGAKARAMTLSPSDDLETVKKNLKRTTDAVRLIDIKGVPSFGMVKDVSDAARRAEKGAVLTPRELLDCANILRTARILSDYIKSNKPFDTSLDELFGRLMISRPLEERISRSILSEDMIADEASPALADIRRKINGLNNRIREMLQHYIGGSYSKYLQENLVTMRGGRYVIPVKAECKGDVKGLVHDTSSSGATLFIEPMPVVDANNELRTLQSKEEHEIEKILAELSAAVSEKSEVIMYDYENITTLAYIFACAELSGRMKGTEPQINTGKRTINLLRARHPLIDKNRVVPVNISIGGSYDTMIITGPNTGGKTVTLKTLGLFALMTQSGLHIPADDGSSVCIFDHILVDIGDDQSIEQSLSTFSSHMVNIVRIVKDLTPGSLVLFDELGVGTDPVEGAALAMAVIEHVRSVGAMCAATTHYAELKAYALSTPGVRNASCEFDVETLRPTYKLIIGTPGKSNAFAISSKLGLPDKIIRCAQGHVTADSKKFEDVIGELERTRLEMERERDELRRSHEEYEKFRAEKESEIKKKADSADKELEKARAQAVAMVEGARASSNFVFDQLEKAKKAKDSSNFSSELEEARRAVKAHLREHADEIDPIKEQFADDKDYVLPRPLKVDDDVYVTGFDQTGKIATLPDRSNNVYVYIGAMKVRVKLSSVRLIENDNGGAKVKKPVSTFTADLSHGIRDEIDLRGLTGDEAWFKVDKYLDSAGIAGFTTVRLIHGKGTGALKNALWKYLKGDKRIKHFRIGQYGEGDGGVTVVELRK